jgi:UMP-CMP kinase
MVLSFCPFSLGVFLGTALLVTLRQHQLRLKQLNRVDSIDVDVDMDSLDDLPVCQVVFVLGGPGSARAQCVVLTTRNKEWAHLSAGDLLRAERTSGGPIGDLINKRIAAGQLVPAEITCKLLENVMKTMCRGEQQITKFLIDGYPRNQANIDAWVQTMTKHTIEFVLYFECPEEVLVGRLLERGQTGQHTEVIMKALQTDKESTYPILKCSKGQVRKIASLEDVSRDIVSLRICV